MDANTLPSFDQQHSLDQQHNGNDPVGSDSHAAGFDERVRLNQQKSGSNLQSQYDFIVCGAGSSGCVVARRLAENPAVSVLLLEAGRDDNAPEVTDPARWINNLGSERDWGFRTRPNPCLNGRSLLWSMGKILGGGSSINGMIWSRGHKNDWDYFASESGDPAWSYDSVLDIYRQIEDWHGEHDPQRRGTGGLVFVQPAPDPNPLAPAMLEAARSCGIPAFADQNGILMEGDGGCALTNLRIRDGRRLSIFRSYLYPYMDRPNLTVLTGALVTRLLLEGNRAVGVEVLRNGGIERFMAGSEVVLSLGAIHTPKVLMQSGIGEAEHLRKFGIEVVQSLPGVGRNLQEHILLASCLWEYVTPLPPRNNAGEVTFFWKSDSRLDTPDLQPVEVEVPFVSDETARLNPPAASWGIAPGLVRPASRGRLWLTGPGPSDPVDIDAGLLSDPADVKALIACVQVCREIGNAAALRPYAKREVMPGSLRGAELDNFIRNAAIPYWHQTCTAKMGRDPMSVVAGDLKVYGIERLRIADGSVMPRVTTGNTMAPCVIIGERAAALIRQQHSL